MKIMTLVTLVLPFVIHFTALGDAKAFQRLDINFEGGEDPQVTKEKRCSCESNEIVTPHSGSYLRGDPEKEVTWKGHVEDVAGSVDTDTNRVIARGHQDQEVTLGVMTLGTGHVEDTRDTGRDGILARGQQEQDVTRGILDIEGTGDSDLNVGTASFIRDEEKEDANVIKQVIFIEPPQYIYKHEFKYQQPRKAPKTVIYVFPPEVRHEYNVTDNRVHQKPEEPTIYYLTMKDLLEMEQQLGFGKSAHFQTSEDSETSELFENSDQKLMREDFDTKVSNSLISDDATSTKHESTDGFNLIDIRIGSANLAENITRAINTSAVHKNPDSLQENGPPSPLLKLQGPLSTFKSSFNPKDKDLQENPTNPATSTSHEYPPPPTWKIDEHVDNQVYDSQSEERGDFEIISAILQSSFYISPDGREHHY